VSYGGIFNDSSTAYLLLRAMLKGFENRSAFDN